MKNLKNIKVSTLCKMPIKRQGAFILPITLIIMLLLFLLLNSFNWQNLTQLKTLAYKSANLQIQDVAQRQIALLVDSLNTASLADLNADNYTDFFGKTGSYINAKAKNVQIGLKGVKSCKKKYNASLSTLAKLDADVAGCAQVAIIFPQEDNQEFYFLISLQITNSKKGIKKFYQAVAYNFVDARKTSLPAWLDSSGASLGKSGVELAYKAECNFFKTKIYADNPCR